MKPVKAWAGTYMVDGRRFVSAGWVGATRAEARRRAQGRLTDRGFADFAKEADIRFVRVRIVPERAGGPK